MKSRGYTLADGTAYNLMARYRALFSLDDPCCFEDAALCARYAFQAYPELRK